MNNTLIIYDNANTKINNVLNKISEVIVDSKLHQVSDELKNIDNYSNIAVTIAMEDENNFKLYKSLRNYNIDFTCFPHRAKADEVREVYEKEKMSL